MCPSYIFLRTKAPVPGHMKQGTRLPNHGCSHRPAFTSRWRSPLNMALSPDGKLLAVTNNGFSRHFISLISTEKDTVVSELETGKSSMAWRSALTAVRCMLLGKRRAGVTWQKNGDDFIPGTPVSLKGTDAPPRFSPPEWRFPKTAGCSLSPETGRLPCLCFPGEDRVEKLVKTGPFPYDIKVLSKQPSCM